MESDQVSSLNKMSREELYEAVWSEAMSTLAPKLGISDVGLKKRCSNLGIPTPTRGYWAKLQNGKKVKKELLPASWTIVRKKKRIPKSADDLKKYTPPERDYSIEKLPPIVMVTKRALLRQKPSNDYGLCEVWQQGVLRTKVAPPNIDRAIWLWTELIKSCKMSGLRLADDAGAAFTDGKQTVTIDLKEKTSRYMTNKPKVREDRFPLPILFQREGPTPEHAPTGFLQFRAEDVYDAPCSKQWSDSMSTPLDEKIPDIASCLVMLLKRKEQREKELKEAEVLRREQERLRFEEQNRQRKALEREKKLLSQAGSLRQAEDIRHLADQVRIASRGEESEAIAEWITWASQVASKLDPVSGIVERLKHGKDPSAPESEDLEPEKRWLARFFSTQSRD